MPRQWTNGMSTYQMLAALFMLSGGIALLIVIFAVSNQRSVGSRHFAYAMAAVAVWCFSDSMYFLLAADGQQQWFWTVTGFSASILCVPIVFVFACYFARLEHWLTPVNRILLWAPFVIAAVLAVTNRWHGLIWDPTISPMQLNGVHGYGVYFIFIAPISYALALVAVVIFLLSFWRLTDIYRRQAIVLSVAVLLPLAGSMLYFTPLNPWPNVDLAPAVFAFSGLLLLYGLARLRILELRPIFRDAVFKQMSEGAAILDSAGRIVDVNPAGQRLLVHTPHLLGDDAATALARTFAIQSDLDLSPGTHHSLTTLTHPPRNIDLRVGEITGQSALRLLIFHDTTRLHAATATISAQEQHLAERARTEAAFKLEVDQIVGELRTQIRAALDSLDRGRLGATATLLAQMDAVTTENLLRRTQTFYESGIQAADFFAALQLFIGRFAASRGLSNTVEIEDRLDADRLAATTRLQVVRILQAALDNVSRHAQAQHVTVSFERTDTGVAMTVHDDGIGFDPGQLAHAATGGGFADIRRRAGLIGGSVSIVSVPGAGVAVRSEFPEAQPNRSGALQDVRVLLAVEHPLVCDGFHALLIEHGLIVDATATDLPNFLNAAARAKTADLALIDIDLPGIDDPTLIRQIRTRLPGVRVVVLSDANHPHLPLVFHLGADSYLPKSLHQSAFFDALAQIVAGATMLPPNLATQAVAEFRRGSDQDAHGVLLTERQRQILMLVGDGMTYDGIAARLALSERTIRYHVDQIRHRLHLANRSELALYARRHKLIEPPVE